MDLDTAPEELRPFLGAPGQACVTVGKEYEVHAACVFEGHLAMQFVNDIGWPSWMPAWLFDVVDPSIPADWICSAFHEDPSVVIGPEFIASSLDAHAAMTDLEPEPVARFWKRIDSMAGTSNGEPQSE